MLLFLVIMFYFAIEIGVYSRFRKKVIAAFKLNKKKIVVSPKSSSKEKAAIFLMRAR